MLATLSTTFVEVEPEDDSYSELAELVRLAQDGDREAFGLLVEQFERTVQAICLRRLGNMNEAMELSQEVFLHVLQRIGQLREPERFAGWLRQVTVRMAINRATRRVAPSTVEAEVLERVSGHHDNPLESLISRERVHQLWQAINRLKALDREVLVAFYIQGQSLLEIADQLDAPLGTVKRRLHTARKRLRLELEASVADPDEWAFGDDETDEPEDLPATELVGASAEALANW